MNPHVILVHFPIALLSIYPVLELVRFRRIRSASSFFYIKAFMVIAGELGALAALLTGGIAEDLFRKNNPAMLRIIDVHSTFGGATAGVFGIIAFIYLFAWLNRLAVFINYPRLMSIADKAERFISGLWIIPLALIGLLLVTLTGTLGGAIAFGPDVDPLARFVYNWFGF